jgi:hypothetical protein
MARRTHDVHVSKDGNGWKTSQGGEKQSHHRTQQAAIERGTQIAKQDRVDVVTHGRDGRIRSKDSYGNDPLPPRDTEH